MISLLLEGFTCFDNAINRDCKSKVGDKVCVVMLQVNFPWKITFDILLSRTESGGTEVKDNREKLHSVPE